MAILTVTLFTMALLAYQGKERKQKELIAGLEETFFKVMRAHNPDPDPGPDPEPEPDP